MAMHLKILPNNREKVLMLLFDGGILASFKIEDLSDDIIAALSVIDDELFLDILIPMFFAIASAFAIYLKRRMASQQINNARNLQQQRNVNQQ